MKNLAETFLPETDQKRIESVVAATEKRTAGEIVCMIVSSSYHYAMADVLGATAFALPLALLATHFLGGWLWLGTQNMWLFLGLFALLFRPAALGSSGAARPSSACSSPGGRSMRKWRKPP
jgi:putative membrane protein